MPELALSHQSVLSVKSSRFLETKDRRQSNMINDSLSGRCLENSPPEFSIMLVYNSVPQPFWCRGPPYNFSRFRVHPLL